jgi:hypothetical protein
MSKDKTQTALFDMDLLKVAKVPHTPAPPPEVLCHHLACCVKAKRVFCVCIVSFECPVHGSRCYGTHD